ncbi:MAG TPA: hypothetical protein DCG12_18890, partial [Planctomycetaceae bacterium]|nr:hypothetical protein [Planctomycetaceae bacterium]
MPPRRLRICSLLLSLAAATAFARAGDLPFASSRIDEIIQRDLRQHKLVPNPPASDLQFIRRVYLDVIGRIPTAEELTKFQADRRKERRAKLIDELLASPGHESHMFNWLGD